MTSVDAYHAWNVTFPAVFSFVLWFVTLIAVILGFPLMKKPRIFVEILQYMMPDLEAKDKEYDEDTEIDGADMKKWTVYILSIVFIPIAVSTIFMSFWNVFLVEQEVRGSCEMNFDCFPMYDGRYIQRTPVDNCSQVFDIDDLNNAMMVDFDNLTAIAMNETDIGDVAQEITYECYRYVFRYAEGIGAAGGVLFFTGAFSKLYFGILVALIVADTSNCYNYLRLILLIGVWIIAAVLWILFIVINTAVPLIREAVFQTDTDTIQFVMYVLNFLAVVVSGYIISAGVIMKNWG